jgi:DNA-binding transcriptional ArsR family regulator
MSYQEIFTALADPTRRQIFESLVGAAKSVNELAESQTVSRPAVSQHLKILRTAGLVNMEPKGNHRMYLIKRDGLEELRQYLDRFWSDALSAYSAEITNRMQIKDK